MEKLNSKNALGKLEKKVLGANFKPENLIKELNSHPLLKDYKVTISNYNRLSLYVEENENCKNCTGLDSCKNNTKGYSLRASNDEECHLEAFPCNYQIEFERIEAQKAKFKTLYLSKSILEANFDDFRLDTVERRKALQYVNTFCQKIKNHDYAKGLYVCGNFQIGKTYFLAATANYLASNDIESLLIYFPDLVRELKSSMVDRQSFENKINMIKTVPVLMLDDLGAEMCTAWLRDEILCPIINYRLQEHLPVFISSNLPLSELMDHYQIIDNDTNNARRLVERIKALITFIEF